MSLYELNTPYRFTALFSPNHNPEGHKGGGLLLFDVRFKRDGSIFRDHCWIKFRYKNGHIASMANDLNDGDVIEFTAHINQYTNKKLETKHGLFRIRSPYRV